MQIKFFFMQEEEPEAKGLEDLIMELLRQSENKSEIPGVCINHLGMLQTLLYNNNNNYHYYY